MSAADNLGAQWFHAGEDPRTHRGYVHLGTETAATSRGSSQRARALWTAQVAPSNPHRSWHGRPLDDWTANVLGHVDARMSELGRMPEPHDLDESFEVGPAYAHDEGWHPHHDALAYTNGLEDPGSRSIMVRASALRNVRRVQ